MFRFIGSAVWRRRKLCGGSTAGLRFRRLSLALVAMMALAGAQPQEAAKDFPLRLQEVSGEWSGPLSAEGAKATVLVFVSIDCPISNSYAPKLRRINDAFASKGVVFRLVYPNPDEDAAKIKKHLKEYELPFTAYRDPRHELTRTAKVRVTPEVAVYAHGKGWVYRGRIDDRYVALGKARAVATHDDLREALTAVAAGTRVKVSSTRAVGCFISALP